MCLCAGSSRCKWMSVSGVCLCLGSTTFRTYYSWSAQYRDTRTARATAGVSAGSLLYPELYYTCILVSQSSMHTDVHFQLPLPSRGLHKRLSCIHYTAANSIFKKATFLPSCKSSSNFLRLVGAIPSCFSKSGVTSPN